MAMFHAYIEAYPRENEDWEIIDVEVPFEVEIVNPRTGKKSTAFRRAGKVDLLVRDREGEYIAIDHKTTGKRTETFVLDCLVDQQVPSYEVCIGLAKGLPVRKCMYNVLTKTHHYRGTKKAESEEMFLDRLIKEAYSSPTFRHREYVTLDDERIAQIKQEMWNTKNLLQFYRGSKFFPRNTGYCNQWNRRCEYFNVCAFGNYEGLEYREPHGEVFGESSETQEESAE
jgi:hypothetical protein